jgi:hypothetical protein
VKDDGMADKLVKMGVAWHNVMALYGEAMCSAQILEGELVQILYFLRWADGDLKSEADHTWAFRQLEHLKPSELLEQIRRKGVKIREHLKQPIERAFRTRNFLAHQFFHKYNPIMDAVQCKEVERKLRLMDEELTKAFDRLQPLRLALEKKLNLSEHRMATSKRTVTKFLSAIGSFADE